jgi:acetylornithine deacetylase/succinyl-diaminopimelate desuccinylase-like protein
VAALLDEVGIEAELFEGVPGRTNVVARWGSGDGDALLVHGHLDVVPAEADDWQVHPFSGEVRDGYLWGRGAVDMKDFDAMVLSLVRARARAGAPPRRPVVLCFTADEEAGGHQGAEQVVVRRPELLEGCTEGVGEVGGFSATVRGRRLYLVEAAEKGMAWMRLTAKGHAGHGSMRHPDNAVTALASAVARIGAHEWPVRLTPSMQVLLASVGELAGVDATPDNAEQLVEEFGSAARMLGAVIRHTTNPTMLSAGYKVNVVPGEASAHVDGRFLPGYEDEFFDTLAELVGDRVKVDFESRQLGLETTFDGALVDAMTAALLQEDPDAVVAPYLMSGGTDAKHWTKLGIRCFGFAPLRLPADLDFTALFHGVDERVPTDALEFGARVFDRFLDRA